MMPPAPRTDIRTLDREVIDRLLADLKQTPGIRRVAAIKGQLCAEGAFAATELRRGRVESVVVSALNRLRKEQKIGPLPFGQFELEWHSLHDGLFEFRIYPLGQPEKR